MSTSPSGLPGSSVPVLSLATAPLRSKYEMQRDNADAVQVLVDRTGLPAPTVVAEAAVVHVMLADVDDMAPWLAELDGRVVAGELTAGLRTWTLRTELAATRRRGAVVIEVHALVASGQDVLPSLRSAVSR